MTTATQAFPCTDCGKVYNNERGYLMHRARSHKTDTPAPQVVLQLQEGDIINPGEWPTPPVEQPKDEDPCPECGKFLNVKNGPYPNTTHTGVFRSNICVGCGERFSQGLWHHWQSCTVPEQWKAHSLHLMQQAGYI